MMFAVTVPTTFLDGTMVRLLNVANAASTSAIGAFSQETVMRGSWDCCATGLARTPKPAPTPARAPVPATAPARTPGPNPAPLPATDPARTPGPNPAPLPPP